MSEELQWRDAVVEVLESSAANSMHYTNIAEEIERLELRESLGATPHVSVNVAIGNDLRANGALSQFVKVGKGVYGLRARINAAEQEPPEASQATDEEDSAEDDVSIVTSLGMYWRRDWVDWNHTTPAVLGQQTRGAAHVDFCEQRGVYLLHDIQRVVYVGRAIDRGVGKRLRDHTTDRLGGRWDRFSWFGLWLVEENGTLNSQGGRSVTEADVIPTLEAVLIECLEPPQNRKRGDEFRAVEYLQVEDPAIRRRSAVQLLRELEAKISD